MLNEGVLFTFIAGLFAIMNPIGNVAIFASLTEGCDKPDIRYAAWTCAVACIVTLLTVTWAGDYVLDFFGISVDALRAAGGIIVLLIGLSMLANNDQHRHTKAETEDAKERPEVGVVPMAIPIVAGPGTIATVLIATQDRTWLDRLEISVVIVVMSVAVGLLFSMAKPIADRLGVAGMAVVTRLMGMVLATIAITMLALGFKGLWPGLA
ncbi:MAG: MarC family protein [Methyloceanibacter sp.]|nr:MarC family protein [Methyloceanibacter sp.]